MHKHKLKWQRLPGHRSLKGRAGHTATLVGKDIYVLGGRNGNEFFNDMWLFDTEAEQWKLLQPKCPFSPRAYHTCTLVSNDELWVIGGSDPTSMHSDVHVFNTASVKWSNPATPFMKPRGTHSAVIHPLNKKAILIYGGYGGPKACWLSDLIVFNTDTLKVEDVNPEGARPMGRGYHTLTAFGNYVALFGGKAEGGIINEDKLSMYDAALNRWCMVLVKGEPPSPRSNHASVLTENGLIIIHGGRHGSLRLNDSYCLQVPTNYGSVSSLDLRWKLIERPESSTPVRKSSGKRTLEAAKKDLPIGRSAHSLVSQGQALYLFGGYGGEGLTFSDMFVLRKLPKFPDLECRKQSFVKVSDKVLVEVADTIEEEQEEEEGWRNTKHPKFNSRNSTDPSPHSAAAKLQGDGFHHKVEGAGFDMEKSNMASDTRSTEPIRINAWPQETRAVTSSEDRSLAILVQEKEFYQKEVRSLQKSMETLQATIKDKTLVDLDFQQKSLQLEQEVKKLQKENLQQQTTILEMEKEMMRKSNKIQKMDNENKCLKADVQNAKCLLEDSEIAKKLIVMKMNEYQKELQDVCKSSEESKAAASEAILEQNKLKSCVHALETELEKQMDTLRQVSLRFEGEKAFLLKEIAERKGTTDKLLTEIGGSKECLRSLEEINKRQSKQIEQESAKLAIMQKEREALICTKAVLSSEVKQLTDAKQAAEDNCTLLRSELQAAKISAEQHEAEAERVKEKVDQTREHASSLHESLKKMEEQFNLQIEENNKKLVMMRETEEFEQAQVRLLQAHVEKLRCARQSCSF